MLGNILLKFLSLQCRILVPYNRHRYGKVFVVQILSRRQRLLLERTMWNIRNVRGRYNLKMIFRKLQEED